MIKRMVKRFGWLMVLCLCLGGSPFADVKPHTLISENMVLQRGMPVPIWGTADDGEEVTLQFQDQYLTTKAKDGKWEFVLENVKPGGPFQLTLQGKNLVVINNVMVGDVWICSGQSNMQWPVAASNNADIEIAYSDFPGIRLLTVPRQVAGAPQETFEGEWKVCGPDTVASFSAVGYFFGRELHQTLDVPIGLIHSSWGGTPAESWTSKSVLMKHEILKPIVHRWQRDLENFKERLESLEGEYLEWKEKAAAAEAEGKPVPPMPSVPNDPRRHHWRPSGLFNAMISPLLDYPIKGAIWYQGESNAARAYQYRTLFPAMIKNWRDAWDQGDFPFLFVQLANFISTPRQHEEAWAELREAQTEALSLPNTGMAVTIDIGDPNDIHPRNKQDVGKRLALAAQAIAYGQDVVYSGPIYDSMNIEGDMIRIRFKHVDGGLTTKDGEELRGFTIAGEDQEFKTAQAMIDRDTVIVSSAWVSDPVAVRYSWKDNPNGNLFNEEGLPASPFRTDDWPGVTVNER